MLEIQVNGVRYSNWESAIVSRSLDSASGDFSFVTSSSPGEFPVKLQDLISVIVNGEDKIFGYVEKISASGDSENHTVSVSGRDNIGDLIDSTVPDDAKVIQSPVTLAEIAEKVISGIPQLQISVFDKTGQDNSFSDTELQAAETGDKALEYIQKYARKKQVFIIPDGLGNLILFRPTSLKASSPLLHQVNNPSNNVKSWSVKNSTVGLYNSYVCNSQENLSNPAGDYSVEGMTRQGRSLDLDIRESRVLEIKAEETMTFVQAFNRSKEESNIRRAHSIEYSCTVAGFSQLDGLVWDIGQKVFIRDDFADINGQFIIRSVNYTSQNAPVGSETKIVCSPIDAYTVQSTPSATDTRKSNTGTKFSNDEAEVKLKFNRGV